MARKKIRNYDSVEQVEAIFNEAYARYHDEIIADLLKETGMKSLDELWEFDYHMGFGFDCGWVRVKSYNQEQMREWRLDGDKYSCAYVGYGTPYNTQSTTLTNFQAEWVIKKLGLTDYYTSIRLD